MLPFSWIYGSILSLRHLLYDRGILKSYKPVQKTIVVGNLSLGGTGKTPMVDYLVSLLGMTGIAVLSRGYGRKTKGTLIVSADMTVKECGDEPILLKRKHPELLVIVDANRTRALEFLRVSHSEIKTVILDDAMQHRKINASFYLLLTTWQNPYFRDFLLPAGNLRDLKSRSKKANAILITKTPEETNAEEKNQMAMDLGKSGQPIFFSKISYGSIHRLETEQPYKESITDVVLLTAIANPLPFEQEARKHFAVKKHFEFNDHHLFRTDELFKLRDFIDTFGSEKPVVLTTEKDAQRLKAHKSFFEKNEIDVLYWKIQTDFGLDADKFNALIRSI